MATNVSARALDPHLCCGRPSEGQQPGQNAVFGWRLAPPASEWVRIVRSDEHGIEGADGQW